MKAAFELDFSEDVYEPAEDSYLLANALRITGGSVLDVGCGCGIQSLTASKTADHVVGVDINPKAVELSEKNARLNKVENTEFIISDLFDNVKGRFDTIIFNPPYLESTGEGMIHRAWDGGKDGAEIIRRFIKDVGKHLTPGGKVYLLISSENKPDEVTELLKEYGFTHETVAEKKLFFESLYVIVFKPKP